MLGKHALVDKIADISWLLQCQSRIGGIQKTLDALPDALHAYLGLAALSLHVYHAGEEVGVPQHIPKSVQDGIKKELDPCYNISTDAVEWMHEHLRQSQA